MRRTLQTGRLRKGVECVQVYSSKSTNHLMMDTGIVLEHEEPRPQVYQNTQAVTTNITPAILPPWTVRA